MTHLFNAGFDDCDSDGDALLCGYTGQSGTHAFSTDTRYSVGKSLQMSTTGSSVTKDINEQAGNTLFVGIAVKIRATMSVDSKPLELLDSAGAVQCFLEINTNNVLSVTRGTTVLGSYQLNFGVWHWIECEILVANAGSFKVYVDGALQINITGDTQNASSNSIKFVRHHTGTGNTMLYDDVYIANNAGTLNNSRYGEVVSRLIYPSGDTVSQWTRNTGATDSAAIDDLLGAPDDDTTRIDSTVVGNKNTHALGTLTNVGTVHAVKGIIRATKTDAGARTIKHGVKSGATEQQASVAVTGSYGNSFNYWETSDGVSTQFNQATIDSIEMTIEDFA